MTAQDAHRQARIAVACGGTGGHFYPGLAVAEQFLQRGCAVTLLISPKDVDQQAAQSASQMEIITLPAVGLTRGKFLGFMRGFIGSYRLARKAFQCAPPVAALAMGGFTSAPPLLAARRLGAKVFLHESNSIPGRANRWLSRIADRAFIGFPSAADRLHCSEVVETGTPVRSQFQPADAANCRSMLELDPGRPVVLVMGGSQGARDLNRLVIEAVPQLVKAGHDWQWLHLTGHADLEQVRKAYAGAGVRAVVHPFLARMEVALGAASIAVSRAGASSLAELAAMRLPAVLVPYPAAVDDHQFHNASAFEQTNAARLLSQRQATPSQLVALLVELMENSTERQKIQRALAQWHKPGAAENIAESMLQISGIKLPIASNDASGPQAGPARSSGSSASDSAPGSSLGKSQRANPGSFEPVYGLTSGVSFPQRSSA